MKDGFIQILLVFAIFLLPEIFKLLRPKKKKYNYPQDVDRTEDDRENISTDRNSDPDLMEILFGRRVSMQQEPVREAVVASAVEEKVVESESITQDNMPVHIHRGTRVKISAHQASRGLIMAEIMGKPRALRPLDKELPCRRSFSS